jgi:predicted restriction endonuclease
MGDTLQLEDHHRSNEMKFPSITRQSLSEAQNHRCCYCGCGMTLEDDMSPTMATREHVIPRALGGPTEWWNLVAACNECNTLRGHMSALAFAWMRQTMVTENIIHIRYDRLMQTFDRYEKRSFGKVVVAFNFLHRLFGHLPEIPAVPLKYRDRYEGSLLHNS